MRKFITIILMMLISVTSVTYADLNYETTKINLNGLIVEIPHNKNSISIEYFKNDIESYVIVRDIDNNDEIYKFGEINETIQLLGTYSTVTVYEEISAAGAKARLYTKLSVYNDGSFRQINSVIDTWWAEYNSGAWSLSDEHCSTISRSGTFPTGSIETSGNATVTVETNSQVTGSFSIEALKIAGFTLELVSGSTYYYRKPISSSYIYSLY